MRVRLSRRWWGLVASLLLGVGAATVTFHAFTDGPLTPLFNIRGRTDENGYLRVSIGTAGLTDGALTPLSALRGRTDENGYLRVSISGSIGALPAGSGSELQYRASASAFGAITGSSFASSTLNLGAANLLTVRRVAETPDAAVSIYDNSYTGSSVFTTFDGSTKAFSITKTLGDPLASVITQFGTPGAAAVTYKLVGNTPLGYHTAAGSASTTNTANATLDGTDYNLIASPALAGVVSYDIYRTAGGPSQGKLTGSPFAVGAFPVHDTGLVGDASTPTAVNTTGHVYVGAPLDVGGIGRLSTDGYPVQFVVNATDENAYNAAFYNDGYPGSEFAFSIHGISLTDDSAHYSQFIFHGHNDASPDEVDSLTPTVDVIPDPDATLNLGRPALRWLNGYFSGTVSASTAFRDGVAYWLKWDTDALGVFANDGTTYADIRAANFIMANSSIRGDKTDAHSWTLEAWDVDGAVSRAFMTCTNGNTPLCALATPSGGSLTGDFATLAVATVPVVTTTGSQTLTNKTLTAPVITQVPVAVGSLPSCGAGTANQTAIVNDALAPALGGAVANGGLLTVGVICKSGTGWIVF